MRLFGEGPSGGDDYLSNASVMSLRVSNVARYKGVSFEPPTDGKYLNPPAGYWGKLNKSELVLQDTPRLLPQNPSDGDIPCFDATVTTGGGIDDDTHLMLHFDEESGIPADSSQVEILVTANDTAADAATAKFGKARNLNNSYLSLTCPAMATGTGDFTYEGWFYFNELNKRRGLFGVDMGLYVALWGDNTFGVAISTSGRSWNYNHMDSSRSEATATQGVWQHIALVRNKGNVTLYLNGNSILSFDIGADTVITGNMGNNPFRIGYPLGGMSSVADFCDEFRFSTVARWTGNFTPPDAPYSKQMIEGEWGKLNKSELALKSDVFSAWHQLSDSSAITLDRADGELQKVTLTQNCTLTAPTLDADHPTMLLQVTSSSAVTVTVGETYIVTDHTGTFQVGWYWDGEATRRYPVVEVA